MLLRSCATSLLRNKMRTFLTALGIMIGVASVITTLAVGRAARIAVLEKIAKFGANVVYIWSGEKISLSFDDIAAIESQCPAVVGSCPIVWTDGQIVYKAGNWTTNARGVSHLFTKVTTCTLESGRLFDASDIQTAARVCIIGSQVRDKVFGYDDPIGKEIRVRNMPFKVIGVLKPFGHGWIAGDDDVLMPYTAVLTHLRRGVTVDAAAFPTRSRDDIPRAVEQIKALLQQRHGAKGEDFEVNTPLKFLRSFDDSSQTLSLLLAVISVVSLVVGGVGIASVMLASVTERVREIGVRMAIGARGRDILVQFLAEAVMLAVLGGLGGTLLGFVASDFVERFTPLNATVTGDAVAGAFIAAAVIGLVAGLYPAVKASQMLPVEALRHQ